MWNIFIFTSFLFQHLGLSKKLFVNLELFLSLFSSDTDNMMDCIVSGGSISFFKEFM